MIISTLNSRQSYTPQKSQPEPQKLPDKSGDEFSPSETGLSRGASSALAGVAGVVPGLGAYSNFSLGFGAAFEEEVGLSKLALAGVGANLLGTASLIGSAVAGNSLLGVVGLGLLATSGATGAFVAAKTDA